MSTHAAYRDTDVVTSPRHLVIICEYIYIYVFLYWEVGEVYAHCEQNCAQHGGGVLFHHCCIKKYGEERKKTNNTTRKETHNMWVVVGEVHNATYEEQVVY